MQYVPSLLPITGLSHSPTLLPSEALSLFLIVHSLSCFIPPSDYPPFLYPFLPLPIFLVLMFHRWEKSYDDCLSLLDLFHLALSHPVPSVLEQTLRSRWSFLVKCCVSEISFWHFWQAPQPLWWMFPYSLMMMLGLSGFPYTVVSYRSFYGIFVTFPQPLTVGNPH